MNGPLRPRGAPPLPTPMDTPPLRQSLWRMALRILLLGVLIWGAHWLMSLAMDAVAMLPQEAQGSARTGVILAMLALYALLIALPFVPGVEIGIGLMMLSGAVIAPAVYLCTVTGLMLAYLAGRFLPHATLRQFFADLRLRGACRLLDEVAPLSRTRRLALIRRKLPGRLGGWAVRFRYVSLAVLFNIPGSTIIGGGGGIALIAGMTGLFGWRAMLVTLLIATAPVPLAVWLFGTRAIAVL